MRSSLYRRGAGALAAAVALLALAACSSSSSSSSSQPSQSASSSSGPGSSSGSSSASASASGSGQAAAAAKAHQYEATSGVTWPFPKGSYAPGTHRLAIVSCGLAGAGCDLQSMASQAAAKAMGWQSTVFDGAFDPNKEAGFVQQAVQQRYDAIVLNGIDVNSIKSAVQAAISAKIPVGCSECNSGAMSSQVHDTTYDWQGAGVAMGDYVLAHMKPGSHVAVFTDKAFPTVTAFTDAATATIKAGCSSCTLDTQYEPTTDLTKPGPPAWTAYLASHPAGALDWVVTGYENMAISFAKTLQDDGRNDIHIVSLDGVSPQTTQDIESSSNPFEATMLMPKGLASWAAVDQVARQLAGAPAWDTTHFPWLLLDRENIAQVKSKNDYQPSEFNFQASFEKLWGR